MSDTGQNKRHGATAVKLAVVVVAMFGFGYALVPLYDMICDITGLNGKTGQVTAADAARQQADETRTIKVEFVTNVNAGAPWEFSPSENSMEVHPGGTYRTTFYARNKTSNQLTGQAVPSVSPREASLYFNKTECFCFTQQAFDPGQARDMPVQFVVDSDLPEHIDSLVLSYTFFNATPSDKKS